MEFFRSLNEGQIYIFYGKMGSGKTTNAMKYVLEFRKRGQKVWINFPLPQLPPLKRGMDLGIWFEDDPAGILAMRDGLFVIDEAYMTLNSREWQNLPKAVFTAFTHVRKLHMTVIVIAQSWMRIDKSIREVSSMAREFKGSSIFGRVYNFEEYEIDEMGEIIKAEHQEMNSPHAGVSLVRKEVYDSFDTDYLFAPDPPKKTWKSAIGMIPDGSVPNLLKGMQKPVPSLPGKL